MYQQDQVGSRYGGSVIASTPRSTSQTRLEPFGIKESPG